MQLHDKPIDFQRRFGRMDFRSSNDNSTHSDEIAQQIAEFERNGGTIKTIPNGVSGLTEDRIVVSSTPDGMAIARPNGKRKKTAPTPRIKPASESGLINITDAAKILGISYNAAYQWTKKGKLKVVNAEQNTREKLVRETEVRALRKAMLQPKKPSNPDLFNMKDAAALLGVSAANLTAWVNKGILQTQRLPEFPKKYKFVNIKEATAIKEKLAQENKK